MHQKVAGLLPGQDDAIVMNPVINLTGKGQREVQLTEACHLYRFIRKPRFDTLPVCSPQILEEGTEQRETRCVPGKD